LENFRCLFLVDFSLNTEHEQYSEKIKECGCLPSCNSITYEQTVMVGKLETTQKVIDNNTVTVEHGMMRFYFGSDEYTALRRYGSYDIVTFLSECGGILGLFLGVSALTIVEFFYFFVIRVISNFLKRLKNNTKVLPLTNN
jgi:hypothetical protein